MTRASQDLTATARSLPFRGYIWHLFLYAGNRIVVHKRKTSHGGTSYQPAEAATIEEARDAIKEQSTHDQEQARALKALESLTAADDDDEDDGQHPEQPSRALDLDPAASGKRVLLFVARERHETPVIAQATYTDGACWWTLEAYRDGTAAVWRRPTPTGKATQVDRATDIAGLINGSPGPTQYAAEQLSDRLAAWHR